jgi:hypothetical protein
MLYDPTSVERFVANGQRRTWQLVPSRCGEGCVGVRKIQVQKSLQDDVRGHVIWTLLIIAILQINGRLFPSIWYEHSVRLDQ